MSALEVRRPHLRLHGQSYWTLCGEPTDRIVSQIWDAGQPIPAGSCLECRIRAGTSHRQYERDELERGIWLVMDRADKMGDYELSALCRVALGRGR